MAAVDVDADTPGDHCDHCEGWCQTPQFDHISRSRRWGGDGCPYCREIAQARADERETIIAELRQRAKESPSLEEEWILNLVAQSLVPKDREGWGEHESD